jgi:hypothetical protein
MEIGITGSRSLTYDQETRLLRHLSKIPSNSDVTWHIGDAKGVDQTVRDWAAQHDIDTAIYMIASQCPRLLVQRSKEMVSEIAFAHGELYAFPNQSCPPSLTPKQCQSWYGSDTWGTIAYALSQSVIVHIYPLASLELPEWCRANAIAPSHSRS